MERLKIELFRYEELVFGKILEMDESLRDISEIVDNGTFRIYSESCPDLDETSLYIRGTDEESSDVFSCKCHSVAKAIEICESIKMLVDEINSVKEAGIIESKVLKII